MTGSRGIGAAGVVGKGMRPVGQQYLQQRRKKLVSHQSAEKGLRL